jgi:hypothetical protein
MRATRKRSPALWATVIILTAACAGAPQAGAQWAAQVDEGTPAQSSAPAKKRAETPAKTGAKQAPNTPPATKRTGSAIVAVVGDEEPITAYEIEQRQRLLAQGSNIQEQAESRYKSAIKSDATKAKMKQIQDEVIATNQGKSREQIIEIIKERLKAYALTLQKQAIEGARAGALSQYRTKALEELIDERLMFKEARRLNALASEEDVDKVMADRAARSKVSAEQFAKQFQAMGMDVMTLRSRIRAQMSWTLVVRRLFGQQIAITEKEVDKFVRGRDAGRDRRYHRAAGASHHAADRRKDRSEAYGQALPGGRGHLAQVPGLQVDSRAFRRCPGRQVRGPRIAPSFELLRAHARPAPRCQGWRDAAAERRSRRRRALGRLQPQDREDKR